MSAPIDVLAFMDRAMSREVLEMRAPLAEARAAMAELIAADKEYDAAREAWFNAPGCVQALGDTDGRNYDGPEYERLRVARNRRTAALARVGGDV